VVVAAGEQGRSAVEAEGVWYLAELLFAEPPLPDRSEYQCESSNVVFQAASAVKAYRKAIVWGLAFADEPPAGTFRPKGV
jgi:hypothetical protein